MIRSNHALAYPDATPLKTLATPELVLVTTLRLWVAAVCGPVDERNPDNLWYSGLAAAGVSEEGSMAFHELMEAIVLATSVPLDFRPAHCKLLGRDEGRLLQTVSLLQRNRKLEAASILSDWMPPAGCRLAGTHALLLAEVLVQAGLTMPLRGGEVRAGGDRSPRKPAQVTARTSTLVH